MYSIPDAAMHRVLKYRIIFLVESGLLAPDAKSVRPPHRQERMQRQADGAVGLLPLRTW